MADPYLSEIKSLPGVCKVIPVVNKKFYFAITSNDGLELCLNVKNDKIIFYCAHNNLNYQGFIFDFGPYDLANCWKYCFQVRKFLKLAKEQNKVLVHVSCWEKEKLVNSAFVCGCYSILYLNYQPDAIYGLLSDGHKIPFVGYRDASVPPSPYSLSLLDCFKAIEKASRLKFLDLDHFDVQEYVHYEKVKNGDLNWIIPNKMLAFSGPHNRTGFVNNFPQFEPSFYFDYFRKKNVTTIIRLNEKRYDERKFTDAGFEHKDLFFQDGTSPNLEIMQDFLTTCENAKGAIAVHCRAGLGRTGTLIACYLIKHFRFSAHEAIAWTRICRPGSVIANQQTFLVKNEPYLQLKGQLWNIEHGQANDKSTQTKLKLEKETLFEKQTPFENATSSDHRTSAKTELNSKVKKITSKLRMFNLKMAEQQDEPIENNKETQGDILNMLKWTRSKSKLKNLDLVNKVLDCDEKTSELFRLTDSGTRNSNLSIKKLIQHYNAKCSESERESGFLKKKIGADKPGGLTIHYRTRSFTSLLNRSKIHGANPITKPNLINSSTLMADKLIRASNSNLKIKVMGSTARPQQSVTNRLLSSSSKLLAEKSKHSSRSKLSKSELK